MRATELRKWAELQAPAYDSEIGDTSTCVTGEPYVSLVNDVVKPEGDLIISYATNEAEGCALWKKGFTEYCAGKEGGLLFWRETPTWEWRGDDLMVNGEVLKLGVVWSRLVVSELESPPW